jgi:hypothetical protein
MSAFQIGEKIHLLTIRPLVLCRKSHLLALVNAEATKNDKRAVQGYASETKVN